MVPGADIILEINTNACNDTNTPLSLEFSLCLECGLNGKWVVKHSNVREVGWGSVKPTQVFRPFVLSKAKQFDPSLFNISKPKPNLVWRPKIKELNSLSLRTCVSQPPGKFSLLPSVSTSLEVGVLSSDGVGDVPITPLLSLMVTAA